MLALGAFTHANAPGACSGQVDVVNAHARSADHLQSITGNVDHLRREFGGASNDDGVKLGQCAVQQVIGFDVLQNNIMARFFQTLHGLVVHSVGDGDVGHASWVSRRC